LRGYYKEVKITLQQIW